MAKRLFEDNDAWDEAASRCGNEVELLFAAVLTRLEAHLGESVDLRDFHFVGANALASFVAELSIRRRLGDKNETPRDKSFYPRLDAEDAHREMKWLEQTLDEPVEGHHKWRCGVMLDGSNCLYQDREDPMHDECINCGEPEERK